MWRPLVSVITTLYYVVIIFFGECEITCFLCTMCVFEVQASPSPPRLPLCQFCFFCGLHCLTSSWSQSVTQSPRKKALVHGILITKERQQSVMMLSADLNIAISPGYNLDILSIELTFQNHGIVTRRQYEQQILVLILQISTHMTAWFT